MADIFNIFEEILTDDEEDLINIIEAPRRPKQIRPRPRHMEEWNDQEFINRFRLSKAAVLTLLEQIQHMLLHTTERNHALSPLTQLLIGLRFFACGSMLIVAGDFGGIHKSTTCQVIKNVSRVIASLSHLYIKMPTDNEEISMAKEDFYNIARFPNIIGAIDCTHIRIHSPGGENAELFRNRKGYFSFNVQTVANAKCKICNIVVRWPGATHDSRIFNNSRLKAELEDGRYGNNMLLGDSGYALAKYLMTPLQNPQSPEENLYNESHIRTRNVVERSYGIWKRRFPILRLEMRLKLDTVQAIIVATAVLHNIALDMANNEPDDEHVEQFEDGQNGEANVFQLNENGLLVRQNLINEHFSHLL